MNCAPIIIKIKCEKLLTLCLTSEHQKSLAKLILYLEEKMDFAIIIVKIIGFSHFHY